MDFLYTDEQRLLQDTARKLTERLATPEHMSKLDEERIYPYEI